MQRRRFLGFAIFGFFGRRRQVENEPFGFVNQELFQREFCLQVFFGIRIDDSHLQSGLVQFTKGRYQLGGTNGVQIVLQSLLLAQGGYAS